MFYVCSGRLSCALAWCFLFSILGEARGGETALPYGSRVWQTEEGLPHNVVHALVQDRAGYLWIGTQNGLARFDGIRFVVYNAQNTPELGNAHIYAMADAPDGLWIGTMENGVVRLSGSTITSFTETDGLACNAIRSMLTAKNGSVWIGTTNGISVFNGKTFKTIRSEGATNVVRALYEDSDGSILAGTGAGVIRIRDGAITVAYLGLPGPAVRSLGMDGRGGVWVGYAGGIVRVHGQQLDEAMSSSLPDNMVNAIVADRRGQIWAGTGGGVTRLAGTNWVVQKTVEGSVFDGVNCLLEDREGNIWAGTRDGLVRFHPQMFSRTTIRQGLAHNNTTTVLQDRTGTIWSGTWGGGLQRIDGTGITIFNSASGLSRDQVLALHEDRSGGLWVGTDFDGGLNNFDGKTNIVYDRNDGLVDTAIRVLHDDRSGTLWIGTSSALVRFRDGKFHRITKADGLAGNDVRVILEDKEGALWIGTKEGLSWIRDGEITGALENSLLGTSMIVSLYQDARDDVWIGTMGAGLLRARLSGSKSNFEAAQVSAFTVREGLFSDDIHEIVEDGSGYFWMTCRYGAFRVHKGEFDALDAGRIQSLHCQSFGIRDGMPSTDCSAVAKPGAWKARDGRLWFATTKGLAVVDPQIQRRTNNIVPGVVIEEIIANKKRLDLFTSPDLQIEPGRGDLEIRFTALSLSQPEKNRFRYRLEGFDADWVEAGNQRTAYYTHVPPGRYEFRVRACNDEGLWNEEGAGVVLTLQPHFWQTTLFKIGVVLSLVGTVGYGVRSISIRRLRGEMRRIQEQNALANERSRIARDMHDDLGARLTQIMFLTDVVARSDDAGPKTRSYANTLGSASRELVQNLDAIVWAVDPGNDTLDQLALYLHDYVDRYLGTAGVQACIEIPCNLPQCVIASQVRHNVFMVVKEALNNSVKYSECTEIHFNLALNADELSLCIRDNGKGFDPGAAKSLGNGLQNMAQRIETIGGKFKLQSELGHGTQIQLQIPLRC